MIAAKRALPGLVPYCTTKAAVAMMTQALAREWARFDINVNAICPGYIETEINEGWFDTEPGKKQLNSYPRRRPGVESDLDGALLLLASPKSRFITGELLSETGIPGRSFTLEACSSFVIRHSFVIGYGCSSHIPLMG